MFIQECVCIQELVGVQTLKFPHTDLVKQLQRKQPVDIKISNYILYTLAAL